MLTVPVTTKGITYEKKNQISNHFILIGSGPLNNNIGKAEPTSSHPVS